MEISKQRLVAHFFSLIWLLGLVYPVAAFIQASPKAAVLAAVLTAIATFVGVYAWLWVRLYARRPTGGIWLAWMSLFAIALLLMLASGQIWEAVFIYVIGSVAGYISRLRFAVARVIGLTALVSAIGALQGAGIWTWSIAFSGLLVGGVVLVS